MRHGLWLGAVSVAAAAVLAGVTPAAAAGEPAAAVEDFAYPDAARILVESGVTVIKGDGNIRYVSKTAGAAGLDCTEGLLQVEQLVGSDVQKLCFEVRGPQGFLTLQIPNIYLMRGANRPVGATVKEVGTVETATVPPGGFFSDWVDLDNVLLELRAADPPQLQPGTVTANGFVARLDIAGPDAGRRCTGALIAPEWVATAASCFAAGPAPIAAGAPPWATTVTVGRPDLTLSTGQIVGVRELVPHPSRDIALARLASRVTDVAPVAAASAAPAVGQVLEVAGFGRTATEISPASLHSAAFRVGSVADDTVAVSAETPSDALCKGDAGGPATRTVNGIVELVALTSTAWQGGCLGSTETQRGAVQTRLDNLAGWIGSIVRPQADFDGDRKRDIAAIDANNNMQLYKGTGTGTLTGGALMWPGGGAWAGFKAITAGDFDGDGKTDIVGIDANNNMQLYKGTGTGTLTGGALMWPGGGAWAGFKAIA